MNPRTLAAGLALALLTTLASASIGAAAIPGQGTPALVVSPVSISVTEPANNGAATPAATATYTVKLATMPVGQVSVKVVAPAGSAADLTVTPSTLSFNPVDYGTAKTVTVTAVNDTAIEGAEQVLITNTVDPAPPATTDPDYKAVPEVTVAVKVIDNDAGIAVVPTGTGTVLKEDAAATDRTDSFTIALGSAPAGTVNIAFTVPSEVGASIYSAKFTPTTWQTPKTVTLSAAANDIDQGDRSADITFASTSTAAGDFYAGITGTIAVTILDDDHAGYNFTAGRNVLPEPVTVFEAGGAPGTYSLNLTSQPTKPVTVTLTPDAQVAVTPTKVVFGAGNWSSAVAIHVTAVNDLVDEVDTDGVHVGTITTAVSSEDPKYGTGTIPGPILVNVTDNDQAGFTVTPNLGVSVTEGDGHGKVLTVALNTRPSAPVTIQVEQAGDQLDIENDTLLFTTGATTWDDPQQVTLRAVNDTDGEVTKSVSVFFNVTSADPQYGNSDVVANQTLAAAVVDNDGVGKLDLGDGVLVAEGGSPDTYTLALAGKPDGDVTVAISTTSGEFTVEPSSITFSATQPTPTCILSGPAVDTQGPIGTATDLVTTATGAVTDVGDLVTGKAMKVMDSLEGSTAAETSSCIIPCPPGAEGEAADCSPCPLDLPVDPDTVVGGVIDICPKVPPVTLWNVPVTITVKPVQDADVEGTDTGVVHHTVTGGGANYAGATISDVPVTVIDDEKAVLIHQAGPITVSEAGATDTYTLELASPPSFGVFVAMSGTGLKPMPTLRFDSETWNVPQTVHVAAVDDSLDQEGDSYTTTIVHSVSSTPETGYDGIEVDDVTVTVQDNEFPAVLLSETLGNTVVIEGGQGDGLNLKLSSRPSANVVVTLTSSDTRLQMPAPLTFDGTNYGTIQQAWVWSRQDTVAQGSVPSTVTVTATSSDPNYGGKTLLASVVVIDDDTASLVATDTNGATVVTEGGAGDAFVVRLSKAPTADVTVTLAVPGGQLNLVGPTTLTFTAANYNAPQTVSVSAVNDATHEGAHSGTVTFTLTSGDSTYNGMSVPAKTVSIVDND